MHKFSKETFSESYRSLLKLGFPVLVTQIGIILVNFADTMMIGRYGVDELAAAAFVNSLFVIVTVMMIGFAGGITPIIGALYGRGEHKEGGMMFRASMQVNVVLSVVFTAVMGVLYFFLDRFGQDPDLLPAAREYYLIILMTMVPMAVFNSLQQTANGTTDTSTPMWIILGADVLNIIGNYLLIFGKCGFPELGLAGAGVSTLASRIFAAGALAFAVSSKRRYKDYWEGLLHSHAGGARRRRVWLTSYPLMIQSGVECALWSVGAVVSGWFGKIELAAYQVVNTISQLGFMTYLSFGVAASIRVANFTGVGDVEGIRRITRACLHIVLAMATVASLVFFFFSDSLIFSFTPDAEVRAYALTLTIPLILYQYCDAIQLTFVNSLRGTSHVKPLLWISLFSYFAIGVPLMLFMAEVLGLETVGVYYSFSGALATAAILLRMAYGRTLRREKERVAGIRP